MIQTSSGYYGDVAKNAKFNYGLAPCPTTRREGRAAEHRDRRRLAWVMSGKKAP